MKKTTLLMACLAVFISLGSCDGTVKSDKTAMVKSASAKADLAAVLAEIVAIEKSWADALNKRDINALMDMYADDAVSMQDGAPTLTGKAAIRTKQEKDFAASPRYASISFETLDIYGTSDEVTEVGISIEKDAAGMQTGSGKYMAVFQKVDGRYKCIREIYNKDSE